MGYRSLDEYLVRLEQAGELVYVEQAVAADLQIAEITVEQLQQANPGALLFTNVTGSTLPVVTNLFGTPRRMAWGLGQDDMGTLGQRLDSLIDLDNPPGTGELLGYAGKLFNMLRQTRSTKTHEGSVPVQRAHPGAALGVLPVSRHWPGETHPTITGAQLITTDPRSGKRRMRLTRAVMLDDSTLGIPCAGCIPAGTGAIPAALVLGGDPAAMWAGAAPVPHAIDPYWLAGWLRGRPIIQAPALTQPLTIPAEAEVVIEGWIDPDDRTCNAVFAGDDGMMNSNVPLVTMHVTAVTHRENAVFPVNVPTRPPVEHICRERAVEKLFVPLARFVMNEISALHVPPEGIERHLAIVSINADYPGQAFKVMHGLWGMGNLAFARLIIVVDAEVDVYDRRAVTQALLQNTDWSQDLTMTTGPVAHGTDDISSRGGKLGIDATCKAGQLATRSAITPARDALCATVGQNWHEYDGHILAASVADSASAAEVIQALQNAAPDHHIILVDDGVDVHAPTEIAWYVLSSVDPVKALSVRTAPDGMQHVTIDGTHSADERPLLIPLTNTTLNCIEEDIPGQEEES